MSLTPKVARSRKKSWKLGSNPLFRLLGRTIEVNGTFRERGHFGDSAPEIRSRCGFREERWLSMPQVMGLKPRLIPGGSDLASLRQTVLEGLPVLAEGLPVEELPSYLGELAGGLEIARWTAEVRLRGRKDALPALLTVKDVAGLLRVDPSTVTRWAAPGGRLSPAVRRVGEATLRFDRRALERLIAS